METEKETSGKTWILLIEIFWLYLSGVLKGKL